MFTSILNLSGESLSIANAFLCIAASILLGFVIAFTYRFSESYSKSFMITLVILPVLVQIVIMLVNGNLGTGIAVLGAFSLVRFRSIPGSSREICFIFFAMAIGLAAGMGYILFAASITLIICGVFLILARTTFGEASTLKRHLKVTIPENLDYTEVFDDLFKQYTRKAVLDKVKTTNLGSMIELQYTIEMVDVKNEKSFLDAIRCRNGNLTIVCSRYQNQQETL